MLEDPGSPTDGDIKKPGCIVAKKTLTCQNPLKNTHKLYTEEFCETKSA